MAFPHLTSLCHHYPDGVSAMYPDRAVSVVLASLWHFGADCAVHMCRGMPEGGRHVLAGSVSMVAYPMQQMAAFRRTEKRQSYGLRIKASLLLTRGRLGPALMAPLTFMSA